jgi:hypothetical protein
MSEPKNSTESLVVGSLVVNKIAKDRLSSHEKPLIVLNRKFACPFCSCFFFTDYDLALHLESFSDKGEAHKNDVGRLHEFVEEFGSERLSDDFTHVEFSYPEQIIFGFECAIRKFYNLPLHVRKKFRRVF